MDTSYRLDKRLVRRAFHRAAPRYDEVAVLQREVGARLLDRLQLIRLRPSLICDVGCATGITSRELMRRYRRSRLVGVDVAPGMLEIARRREPFLRKLWVICADAEAMPLSDGCCDLLFSNLTLDWCQDPDKVLGEFLRVLRPGGLLMFSTFGPDTLNELRTSWREADSYSHVNAFLDMHDIGDAMLRAGFADPVLDVERFTLTYRDVSGLMDDLRTLGAVNATAGRAKGLTGRGRLQAVRKAYEQFRNDGLLPATCEVVYGHAWKSEGPPRRQRTDGRSVVPLANVRKGVRRS